MRFSRYGAHDGKIDAGKNETVSGRARRHEQRSRRVRARRARRKNVRADGVFIQAVQGLHRPLQQMGRGIYERTSAADDVLHSLFRRVFRLPRRGGFHHRGHGGRRRRIHGGSDLLRAPFAPARRHAQQDHVHERKRHDRKRRDGAHQLFARHRAVARARQAPAPERPVGGA